MLLLSRLAGEMWSRRKERCFVATNKLANTSKYEYNSQHMYIYATGLFIKAYKVAECHADTKSLQWLNSLR